MIPRKSRGSSSNPFRAKAVTFPRRIFSSRNSSASAASTASCSSSTKCNPAWAAPEKCGLRSCRDHAGHRLTAKGIASGMPHQRVYRQRKHHAVEARFARHNLRRKSRLHRRGPGHADLIEGGLMANAQKMGDYIFGRIADWPNQFKIVGEVRGRGLDDRHGNRSRPAHQGKSREDLRTKWSSTPSTKACSLSTRAKIPSACRRRSSSTKNKRTAQFVSWKSLCAKPKNHCSPHARHTTAVASSTRRHEPATDCHAEARRGCRSISTSEPCTTHPLRWTQTPRPRG